MKSVIFRKISFLLALIFLFRAESCFGEKLPADLTFLIADLKYNENVGGIKICEIQSLSLSKLYGFDFVNGQEGLAAEFVSHVLFKHCNRGWLVDRNICDPRIKAKLKLHGFESLPSINSIFLSKSFQQAASSQVYDPSKLSDYAGAIYTLPFSLGSLDMFRKNFPGILVIDAAFFPYMGLVGNKQAVAELLDHEKLKSLRPNWKIYPKKFSDRLIEDINRDFPGEIVVIKPLYSTKGNGVIIVSKTDLKSTLKVILKNQKVENPDPSYSYWSKDKSDTFLVEEFISSDPIAVDHLFGQSFDGTMRVAFALTFNEGKYDFHFIECHWKLPQNSIDSQASLNQKHKSYAEAPFFAAVDPLIQEKVEKELREGMLTMYKMILEK